MKKYGKKFANICDGNITKVFEIIINVSIYLLLYIMDKKYNIIDTIIADPPDGFINWCTISFFTPQKIDSLKSIQVISFKIHNGYNTSEQAERDAQNIRKINNNHDVFVLEIGKIYPWDDPSQSETVEYSDKKLNNMETSRRENADKARLIAEQYLNEAKTQNTNDGKTRVTSITERLKKKLYSQNMISGRDINILEERKKELETKYVITDELLQLINESKNIDYTPTNIPVSLKFGCITIYSPAKIGGLKTTCFKIRTMSDNMNSINKKIRMYKTKYPNDEIGLFHIGKWTCVPLVPTPIVPVDQLNYAMKIYLDNLKNADEEFDQRKNEHSKNIPSHDQQQTKTKNKKQKKHKKNTPKETNDHHIGTSSDRDAIDKLVNYIDDPETRDRFVVKETDKESIELDI